MELFKRIALLLFFSSTLIARPPPTHPGQMLFLMRSGKTERAINAYFAYAEYMEEEQFELLHEMAWALIEEGARSSDPEIQMLSLFGASLAQDERALPILIRSLTTPNPQVQLACIHFLAKMHHDIADKEICSGMASNELMIRLETLLLMAEKKMPDFCLQGECLMSKLPSQLHFLFPPLFALCGDAPSLKKLRRFLSDPDEKVKAASIISVEQTRREEFLPQVRRLSKSTNPLVQEAAASCLGNLKDDHAREHLTRLANSKVPEVRTSALKSLWTIGDRSIAPQIFEEAKKGNLYALNLLGKIDGYDDFILHNTKHQEATVRLNASIALLEKKDRRCLKPLIPFLLEDVDNWALIPHTSISKGLQYFKWIPSAKQQAEEKEALSVEMGLRAKEAILAKAMDLPEEDFLTLAEIILDNNVKALLPTLVQLLERCHSEESIALLQKYQQKIGAPLVRQLCSLGLYRLGIPGHYRNEIRKFVEEWNSVEMIQFRPLVAQAQDPLDAVYELTPEEISRILVESLESLVQMHDKDVIEILLKAILNGHKQNKYALAGVLIRATQ